MPNFYMLNLRMHLKAARIKCQGNVLIEISENQHYLNKWRSCFSFLSLITYLKSYTINFVRD